MATKTNKKKEHVDGEPEFEKMANAAVKDAIFGFIIPILFPIAITEANIGLKSKNILIIRKATRAKNIATVGIIIWVLNIICFIASNIR